MTVNEAYKRLKQLRKQGLKDTELIATCGSSGMTANISIGSFDTVDNSDGVFHGVLEEMPEGAGYVPIHLSF